MHADQRACTVRQPVHPPFRPAVCTHLLSVRWHRLRDASALPAAELLLASAYGVAPDWDRLAFPALLQLAVLAHDHGLAPLKQVGDGWLDGWIPFCGAVRP